MDAAIQVYARELVNQALAELFATRVTVIDLKAFPHLITVVLDCHGLHAGGEVFGRGSCTAVIGRN